MKNLETQLLYAISDEILTPYNKILQLTEIALKSGVKIFQLRDKTHTDKDIKTLCLELNELCKSYNAIFIINDRLELALELKIAVHLGKDELHKLSPKTKPVYLGISCYNSIEKAKIAQDLGADYIAFGSCFASSTKPNATLADLDIFSKARDLRPLKCAIGGITPKNVKKLQNADMIAVIRAIWEGDIAKNVADFMLHLRSVNEN